MAKKRLVDRNAGLEKANGTLDENIRKENPTTIGSTETTTDSNKKSTQKKVYVTNLKTTIYKNEIDSNTKQIAQDNVGIEKIDHHLDLKRDSFNRSLKPEKKGFLNETDLLFNFIFSSSDSSFPKFVWLFFLMFFLGIELFILITKAHKEKSDYEELALYQEDKRKMEIEHLKHNLRSKIEIQERRTGNSQGDTI